MFIQCKSQFVIFVYSIQMKWQEDNVLKSLLNGYEVQLDEGAFGPLSCEILRLFTEAKRTHSEQTQDLDNIPIVSLSQIVEIHHITEFLSIFHSLTE